MKLSIHRAAIALIALLPAPALAQRHVWLVPGTAGIPFEGVRWDRATGRIIAASGSRILRIDPVTGCPEELYRTRGEAGAPAPGILKLVLDPGGAIDFTTAGPHQWPDGRIWRLEPDGKARVIAGQVDDGPFIGEAEDALAARFRPADLSAGPGGRRYVADPEAGRVLLLEPRPGDGDRFSLSILAGTGNGQGAPDNGYDADAWDGMEDGEGDGPMASRESLHLEQPPPDPDPRRAALRPRALAAAPDGSVFLADWSAAAGGRPPCVFQITPARIGADPERELLPLPAPAMEACACPPGQHLFPVRKPHQLAVDAKGTVTILGHGLIWSYQPLAVPEGKGSAPRWRCEAIAGPLECTEPVDAWPPQGAPAVQVGARVLARVRHLEPVPGGGLLLTDGVDGIRFIGPPGDAELGNRVRAYARARAGGNLTAAQEVLDGLKRQRDGHPADPFNLPFRRLGKGATVSSRLDQDTLGVIGSFLADPGMIAFRAAMAVQAINAGADGGPDPRARILAQRHVWELPQVEDQTLDSVAWDPATGTLVAAGDGEIRRLDPARDDGSQDPDGDDDSLIFAIPEEDEAPEGHAQALSGQSLLSVAVRPDGAIHFSSSPDGSRKAGQIWRLTPQGEPRLLAGRLPDGPAPGMAAPGDAIGACDLAFGPGGELYAADFECGQVLRLTPGSPGEPPAIQRIARGIGELHFGVAVGDSGEVLVSGNRRVLCLRPDPGRHSWRRQRLPLPGTPGCSGVYSPVCGAWNEIYEIYRLFPGRDGVFYAQDSGQIWEFTPAAPGSGGPRWRGALVTVAGRHVLDRDDWRGEPAALPPMPPDFMMDMNGMAGVPGGGLLVYSKDGDVRFIGPPGDGALFERVLAFHQAEEAKDQPKARRILLALVRQRRITDREAHELPFLPLARRGLGDRLGRLPATTLRLVGSFLVRPRVIAFRAGLAVQTILDESETAQDWVSADGPAGGSVPAPVPKKARQDPAGGPVDLDSPALASAGAPGDAHPDL
jgi:hypothetical protein